MFMPIKTIGSQIGLPFLSQDEDARLQFRSGQNGIKRLSGREVISLSDVGYWSQFWMLFESANDVNTLVTAQDIRQTLQTTPRNLSSLIHILSSHLFSLVSSPTFPTNSSTSSTSSTSLIPANIRKTLAAATATATGSTSDPTKEVLNCLRVLGRVLPVIYEREGEGQGMVFEEDEEKERGRGSGGGEGDEIDGIALGEAEDLMQDQKLREHFGWEVLWRRPLAPKPIDRSKEYDSNGYASPNNPNSTNGNANPPLYIDPLTAAAQERERKAKAEFGGEDREGEMDKDKDRLPSLADRLFGCTVDLLFCAGFTVPEAVRGPKGEGDKINYVIWEKGVGSNHDIGSSPDHDRHKIEVLRFLLTLLSSTIYTSPHNLPHSINRPLHFLAHSLERRLVLSLLCSWLNTSLSRGAGWGENIPYNYLITRSGEDRRTLVRMSLMVLLVAIDHWKVEKDDFVVETPGLGIAGGSAGGLMNGSAYGSSSMTSTGPGGQESVPKKKEENAFRYFMSKLHRQEDFSFLLDGILSILAEQTAIKQNVLPGSKKAVPYILEIFMLFWKLVDLNKRFRAYVHDSGKMPDIVAYILVTCLELKDNPAHHGLLRMLSYILQALSADRAFGPAMNKSPEIAIPVKWAVQGSMADFMVVSIYSIATTPGLNPLFPALTISISNIAPYLKGIGVQAATRLLQLFKAFSSPNFLLADEGHPRLVYYLLETFNGVLFNRLQDNPNLVYAILRSHQDFQDLATFTLLGGLKEIQRKMLARAAANLPPEPKVDSARPMFESPSASEKAFLFNKEDESRSTLDLTSPASPTSMLGPRETNLTSPLYTPGEAEEDPMATAEINANRQTVTPKSEKAKGKMRERSDSQSTLTAEQEMQRLSLKGIGPNGYVPTQEWVTSWQKGLPLDPVLLAISELLPKVQELQPATTPGPSRNVINYLRSATLVDVLPPHPAHNPRHFHWSIASTIWLSSLLWGQIYTAMLPTFTGTAVRLFGIKQAAPSRREQAIQNVSNKFMSFVAGSPVTPGSPGSRRTSMSGN